MIFFFIYLSHLTSIACEITFARRTVSWVRCLCSNDSIRLMRPHSTKNRRNHLKKALPVIGLFNSPRWNREDSNNLRLIKNCSLNIDPKYSTRLITLRKEDFSQECKGDCTSSLETGSQPLIDLEAKFSFSSRDRLKKIAPTRFDDHPTRRSIRNTAGGLLGRQSSSYGTPDEPRSLRDTRSFIIFFRSSAFAAETAGAAVPSAARDSCPPTRSNDPCTKNSRSSTLSLVVLDRPCTLFSSDETLARISCS